MGTFFLKWPADPRAFRTLLFLASLSCQMPEEEALRDSIKAEGRWTPEVLSLLASPLVSQPAGGEWGRGWGGVSTGEGGWEDVGGGGWEGRI